MERQREVVFVCNFVARCFVYFKIHFSIEQQEPLDLAIGPSNFLSFIICLFKKKMS